MFKEEGENVNQVTTRDDICEMVLKALGQTVADRQALKGYSDSELGRRAGVASTSVHNIRAGKNISLSVLVKTLDALGLDGIRISWRKHE